MMTPFIVTKSTKSIGIAILLTFLFGPIGLFYASVTGGFIMTFTPIFLGLFVFVGFAQENLLLLGWSFGLLTIFAMTFWLINIIWAVIGVISYNQEIEDEAKRQFALIICDSGKGSGFSGNVNHPYTNTNMSITGSKYAPMRKPSPVCA